MEDYPDRRGGVDLLFGLVAIVLRADLRELQEQEVLATRVSVEGMNFDFVAMNFTGFMFYSIYNTEGYFVSETETGHVDLNDVFFAYHALFATIICVSQIIIYPRGNNKVHAPTIVLLIAMWTFLMVYSTLTMVRPPSRSSLRLWTSERDSECST